MKNLLILAKLLLISSCSIFGVAQSSNLNKAIQQQIDQGDLVGVSVGKYSLAGGAEFWSLGRKSIASSETLEANHIFEIGSLSKVFTGLILSSLHLEGKISIDDTVDKYIPELKGVLAGSLKLVELSTHMSGLPRLPANLVGYDPNDPYAKYSAEDLLKYLISLQLISKPVEFNWANYSNVGVGLLGYTLQRATNKNLDELVREFITRPLGMNSTAKKLSLLNTSLLSKGHNELLIPTPYWNFQNALDSMGALKSTPEDMVKFIEANIAPESTSIAKAIKFSQKPRYYGAQGGIALGWGLKVKDGKTIVMAHNGGTGGYRSNLQILPKDKVGIISLTNTASDPQCIMEILLKNESCSPTVVRRVEAAILKKYHGVFVNTKTGLVFHLSSHFGQLTYEIPGQEMGKTTSISDREFSIKGIASIKFGDSFDSFEFEQAGMKLIFLRKK